MAERASAILRAQVLVTADKSVQRRALPHLTLQRAENRGRTRL